MSLVIVGAGPDLGLAVARRFGREGLAVGLISRQESRLVELAAQLRLDGITVAGVAADIRTALRWPVPSAGWPTSSARWRCSSIRRCPRPTS